ncbi:hypothetical protein [Derxia gummosa]|uniref:Uncharacterized protein n=1 Tax=Derxia gummosa DSM 723 TaxID=1121388 RepID=A0A8B6XC60_9BURK|nr:hypothetical protein [Derxia gummosa]
MHSTLEKIKGQLNQIITQLQSSIPSDEPFGNAHGNWSFPGLTRSELIEEAQAIADLIEAYGGDDLRDNAARLQDYLRRLQFLQQNTVGQIWGNAAAAVPVYLFTLQGLRKALTAVLVDDEQVKAAVKLKKLGSQLRSLEARLNGLGPRTESLETMVGRIELAYNAADQLPTDLESLSEARKKIADLAKDAAIDQADIFRLKERAAEIDNELNMRADKAKVVLDRCETAYSAATSVGLAAAFSERSSALSKSMWFWVIGLMFALVAGGYFGSGQLHALSELLKIQNVSGLVLFLNLLLSLLSIGAPVWFAWLATKQIGQRFRLAEDYAFKASISRAYEGFRREAARFDGDMEARLLTSALTRLDELPLRLIEADAHGSPLHEFASSEIVKQAIRAVPGFSEQVQVLATRALDAITPSKAQNKLPNGE